MNHPLIARLLPDSERRAARQTLWLGGIEAVLLLGGLAQVVISARILGPEGFGVLAVIVAVSLLVHRLLSVPGGEAVTTFVTRAVAEQRPQEAARVVRFTMAVSLGMSLAAYAIIAALVLAAGSLLGIADIHQDVALLYGVVGIIRATRTETQAVLRLADRVPLALAITQAGVITRVALLVTVWLAGGEMLEIVLAHIASVVVNGAGMLAAAVLSAPRAGITGLLRSPSLQVPPDVLRFQTGTFGRTTLSALAYNIDTLLLAQFAGAADVGIYRAARQITDIAHYPFRPLRNGVQPEYSRQWYAGQGRELRLTALRFTLASGALAAALFGILAIFHQPITRLFLGDEFAGVAPLLLILIPGGFFLSSIAGLAALPAAVGRAWPRLAGETAGLLAFAVILLWLTPTQGATGAAWGNTAYYATIGLVLIPFAITILRQSRRPG